MREVRLDPNWEIPTVEVVLSSNRKRTIRVSLVFDTGSGLTQLDVDLMERLGYSALDAVATKAVQGAVGESVEGYVVKVFKMNVLGKILSDVPVLAYDFENFPGIDGLLGWDVIKQLHLEMNGPKGLLKVFLRVCFFRGAEADSRRACCGIPLNTASPANLRMA